MFPAHVQQNTCRDLCCFYPWMIGTHTLSFSFELMFMVFNGEDLQLKYNIDNEGSRGTFNCESYGYKAKFICD